MVAHPYPWQASVIEMLNGPVHSRKVLWLVDFAGCGGKSTFAKWQCFTRKRAVCFSYGKGNDLLHLASKHGAQRVFFFDLTRAKASDLGVQDLYQAIEQIKNGHIMSGKYEGTTLLFKRPHVVVFSNQEPQREHLSADRWDVRYINPHDHTMCHARCMCPECHAA